MKILKKLREVLFGKPADKYRIYRRGDGKYIAGLGNGQKMKPFVEFATGKPIEYGSIKAAEFAIDAGRLAIERKELDNKLTFIKEIA